MWNGLATKLDGAGLDPRGLALHGGVAAGDDDRQVREEPARLAQHGLAGDAGQGQVEQHRVHPGLAARAGSPAPARRSPRPARRSRAGAARCGPAPAGRARRPPPAPARARARWPSSAPAGAPAPACPPGTPGSRPGPPVRRRRPASRRGRARCPRPRVRPSPVRSASGSAARGVSAPGVTCSSRATACTVSPSPRASSAGRSLLDQARRPASSVPPAPRRGRSSCARSTSTCCSSRASPSSSGRSGARRSVSATEGSSALRSSPWASSTTRLGPSGTRSKRALRLDSSRAPVRRPARATPRGCGSPPRGAGRPPACARAAARRSPGWCRAGC